MINQDPLSDTLDFGRGKQFSNQKLFFHTDKLQSVLDGKVVNPSVYEISPIGYCNQDCFYCCSSRFHTRIRTEQPAFLKTIDQIKALDGKAITFTGGGEPLLYPGIENLIIHAKKTGLSVGLLTNGAYMLPLVQNAVVGNCSFCRVSLDTVDPHLYHQIRRSRALPTVLNNLKYLVAKRNQLQSELIIGVQIVWTNQSVQDIENTISEIKKLGVNFLQIRPIDNAPDGTNFEIQTYIESNLAFLKSMVDRYSDSQFNLVLSTDKWYETLILNNRTKSYHGCIGANFTATVGPDNHLYFCCSHISNPSFDLGDLSDHPLEQLLLSENRLNLIEGVEHTHCQTQCRNHVNNKIISKLQTLPKEHISTLINQNLERPRPLHWEFL